MKPTNLISAYQGIIALKNAHINAMKPLKLHEAEALKEFCKVLISNKTPLEGIDGFYVGYSLKQISKEFDLLRFSDHSIINIELKSQLILEEPEKHEKIKTQMKMNHYYLKVISENVLIYTYVGNDGLYKYDSSKQIPIRVDFSELINDLITQSVNYNIDPDKLFVPKKYLISPFNNTQKFLFDEYFLNDAQQSIKKDILESIYGNKLDYYCISASFGTGKTLLMYDIVKTIKYDNNPLIIHCGKLNEGHIVLINSYGWKILSIGSVNSTSISEIIPGNIDVIFIDESQRIRDYQLKIIIERAKQLNTPIVFAYDIKQYLKEGETKNIYDYIKNNYSDLNVCIRTLKNKIRTNKELASFITNLFEIGKCKTDLHYENISIEYFTNFEIAKIYMNYLCNKRGWKAITYSDSTRQFETISRIANICESNAHDVIGQEFDKVVFVMDDNFRYGENGVLQARHTFYSIKGMLYQIVTRVVNG